jgi:hypothetical protein
MMSNNQSKDWAKYGRLKFATRNRTNIGCGFAIGLNQK